MKNPYKELSPYIESDAHMFKGRTSETEEMYESFDRNEYLVCHADSGEGKSSIIEAGLIPKMKANCYFPVRIIFKSDEHFKKNNIDFENVVCGIIENEIEKLRSNNSISVNVVYPRRFTNSDGFELTNWEKKLVDSYAWLKLRYARVTIDNLIYTPVLIFDQFEEVFTNPLSQEWTDKFFKWLQELSTDLCPQRIINELEKHLGNDDFPEINTQKYFKAIFSLRSEYVGKLDYWGLQRHYIPLLKNNRYLLRPLTIKGAKEVITQQEGYDGLNAVADEIIDVLRRQQKGKNYVLNENSELPCIPALFLSIICSRAFSMSQEERVVFMQRFVAEKDEDKERAINSLIESFYEKAIADCGIPSKDMGVIEDILVNNEGSRQRVSSHADALKTIDFFTKYMEKLKDARLIRVIPEYNREDNSIEFVHDALCPIITKRKEQRLAEETKRREEKKLREQAEKMRNRLISITIVSLTIIGFFVLLYLISKEKEAKNEAVASLESSKKTNTVIRDSLDLSEDNNAQLKKAYDSISCLNEINKKRKDSLTLIVKQYEIEKKKRENAEEDKKNAEDYLYLEKMRRDNENTEDEEPRKRIIDGPGEYKRVNNMLGNLPNIIGDSKYRINGLSVIGELNGTDIAFIRDMIINGILTKLDIEKAKIVSGGNPYYKSTYLTQNTNNDVIGSYMFDKCKTLASLELPQSLKRIEMNAFSGCDALKELTISSGIIESLSISYCKSLEALNLTEDVKEFDGFNLSGCKNLKRILVAPDNQFLKDDNGILYSKDEHTLIKYPEGRVDSRFSVPSSVNIIKRGAFMNSQLTSVSIPMSVKVIESSTFNNNEKLKELRMSNSVEKIGMSAFSGCKSLESVSLPSNLSEIESMCFMGCKMLREISIGENVSKIDGSAFASCSSLQKFFIDKKNKWFIIDKGIIYSTDKKEIVKCPASIGEKIIKIPEGVETIGRYAFNDCDGIESLILPESVTTIESRAFDDCSINSINLPSSLKTIDTFAFGQCKLLSTITSDIRDIDKLKIDTYTFKYISNNCTWIVPQGPSKDRDMYVNLYKNQPWWKSSWTIKYK